MNNKINRDLDKPLYQQVKDYILKNINNDKYPSGEVIPTERELSESFEVSRYTVRRAITELVHAGYLYRVQGKGTFVYDGQHGRGKTNHNIIGVIAPTFEEEYYIKIINGIEKYIWDFGYTLAFSSSNDDYVREAENIQRMKENKIAGLIILPAEDQEDSTAISDLKSEDFPFLLIDRRLDDCETDCVMSDNIKGGYLAAEHLIKLGHEKIAFVKEEYSKTSSIHDRILGYKKALKDYGIEFNPDLVFSINKEKQNRETIFKNIHNFIKKQKPTAIISIHDYLAINYLLKVCADKNIKVPKDISIVGFDNLEAGKHLSTPLTTVTQYPDKIGANSARLILDKVENETDLIHQIYCPVDLISRESTSDISK